MNNWWVVIIPTGLVALLGIGTALIAIGRWTGSKDKAVTALEGFVKEIREIFMPEIRGDIKKIFAKVGEPLTVAASPVRLTQLGEEIATSLKAFDWASEEAQTLLGEVEGKRPFEIDQVARGRVSKVIRQVAWKERIAECAYQYGLKPEDLTATLHIPLRDALLSLAGQTPDDLDSPEGEES